MSFIIVSFPKNTYKPNHNFASIEKKDSQIPISSVLVHKEYYVYDEICFQNLISELCTKGFYFDALNWRQLNNFVRKMGDCINKTNKENFVQVANELVKMITDKDEVFIKKTDAWKKASSKELSYFLYNLKRIDIIPYNNTVLNAEIIEIVNHKLEEMKIVMSNDLFLFSSFYSQDWCKTKMDSLIDNADEEQQKIIKAWHDKVVDGLKKRQKSIEEGTLLAYIHNKFFSGQQNN